MLLKKNPALLSRYWVNSIQKIKKNLFYVLRKTPPFVKELAAVTISVKCLSTGCKVSLLWDTSWEDVLAADTSYASFSALYYSNPRLPTEL